MSSHYPATPAELEDIRESVATARARLQLKETSWGLVPKASALRGKGDYESKRKGFYYCLRALEGSRFSIRHALILNESENLLNEAADRGDNKFFTNLSKILDAAKRRDTGKTRQTKSSRKAKTIALQKFLLDHWAQELDGLPQLCYLTMPGIADIYMALTGLEASDAIKGQCRALRLMFFHGKKIKVHYLLRDETWRFDKPDGTFSLWCPKHPVPPS